MARRNELGYEPTYERDNCPECGQLFAVGAGMVSHRTRKHGVKHIPVERYYRGMSYAEYQRQWRTRNPDKYRDYNYKSKGRGDLERYNKMLALQGNKCAICGLPDNQHFYGKVVRPLHVDHDDLTGKLRGLLCTKCNTGIGLMRDDPDLLRKGISYIESWRDTV